MYYTCLHIVLNEAILNLENLPRDINTEHTMNTSHYISLNLVEVIVKGVGMAKISVLMLVIESVNTMVPLGGLLPVTKFCVALTYLGARKIHTERRLLRTALFLSCYTSLSSSIPPFSFFSL